MATHRTWTLDETCKAFPHQIDDLIERTGYITIRDLLSMVHAARAAGNYGPHLTTWYDGVFHATTS